MNTRHGTKSLYCDDANEKTIDTLVISQYDIDTVEVITNSADNIKRFQEPELRQLKPEAPR